jgi:hypothetical protein
LPIASDRRLLRSRKAVVCGGRTIASDCAGGTQADQACMKIKNAGGEVAVSPSVARCRSGKARIDAVALKLRAGKTAG